MLRKSSRAWAYPGPLPRCWQVVLSASSCGSLPFLPSYTLTKSAASLSSSSVQSVCYRTRLPFYSLWLSFPSSLGNLLIGNPLGMATCHIIIAVIFAKNENQWTTHKGAGWAAVVMVWLFVVHFGYSWGPCAWIIIAEIWPISQRPYGIALGGKWKDILTLFISHFKSILANICRQHQAIGCKWQDILTLCLSHFKSILANICRQE